MKDRAGNQIFRSGAMDADGYIDHDAVIYHTIFGDSTGKATEKVWFADRILSDNRIPPKGYSIENYSFTIPKGTNGPLNIDVKLNYVSASQELSDLLFGKGSVKPPVIEMAKASATIDIPVSQKEMPDLKIIFMLLLIFTAYVLIKWKRGLK